MFKTNVDKVMVGVMSKGLKQNGTLKKGFKFKKGGKVVAAKSSKKR